MEREKLYFCMSQNHENTTTIMDLNDDCLEAVFKQFDDKHNLHSLALTCTRFNVIAKIAFGRYYTTFQRVDGRILNVFAEQITNVTVKTGTFDNSADFSETDLRSTFRAIKKKMQIIKNFSNNVTQYIQRFQKYSAN